jgi:ABC-type nitrate/sulfonate/bicarbonate transport system ATPase subunit
MYSNLRVNTKVNFEFKKPTSQTKRITIVLLTLILLLSPYISYAFDQSNPFDLEEPCPAENFVEESSTYKKNYNVVYQFIGDHEYLFTPLSGTLAGGVRCGAWCALLGGTLGIIDETLVYFGYADKHYLTWGVFGSTIGHTLNPSGVSDLVGVVVGILLPAGVLNDHKELIAPAVLAMAGNPTGALSIMADELAINSGIMDKHYMTFFTVGEQVATRLLGYTNLIVLGFVAILSSVATNYEEEIFVIFLTPAMAPIETAGNLYETYGKFIPKEQLDDNIEKLGLALIGNQFLVQFIGLQIDKHKQEIVRSFQQLDTPNNQAWGGFTSELINFAIFIFPYSIGQAASNRINSYFNKKTKYFLEDEVRSELLSVEAASCLSDDPSTKILTDNLKGDISAITKSGSRLITEAVSVSVEGIYGVGVIIVTSPNMLTYSFLYGLAQSFLSTHLATQQRFYEEKITALNSEIKNIMQHDAENIRTIAESDGIDATKMRLQQLYDAAREHEADKEIWSSTRRFWEQITRDANYIVNYYLVGNELNQDRLPFDNRRTALNANQKISNWLSWSGRNAQDLSQLNQSLNRIIVLEEKIRAQSNNADQINRTIKKGSQLVLQDLEMRVENEVLVSVEDLRLDMGKAYAVTGKPGCGKTNLLFKIKGVKSNGVSGKGHIYYPLVNGKEPKIVMISQQDYFPINFSLQRIISYPDEIPSDPILNSKQKNEMQLLLEEIGLWETDSTDGKNEKEDNKELNLDSVKNWSNVLSGGEKRKVTIVSAIMKKPDILVLDETFDSLGPSLIATQQMLKRYLPNALILVVDHHAQTNNYNHFYDKELSFADKMIVPQEIPSIMQ